MKQSSLLGILTAKKLKKTAIRVALLELLLEKESPIHVSEIKQMLKRKRVAADEATVYRNLHEFVQADVIQEVYLHDGKTYYEKTSKKHHHHIICTLCGSIYELDEDLDCKVKALEKDIEESYGFANVHHALEFFGVCPKCAEQTKSLS